MHTYLRLLISCCLNTAPGKDSMKLVVADKLPCY